MVRDIEFRVPVQASILSERRVYRPYGLHGGEDARCGVNTWVRRLGQPGHERSDEKETVRRISLGGKNTASMRAGERIIIETPGGGGWGVKDEEKQERRAQDPRFAWRRGSIAERASAQEGS